MADLPEDRKSKLENRNSSLLPCPDCRPLTADCSSNGGFVPDFSTARSFVFKQIGGFVFQKALSSQPSASSHPEARPVLSFLPFAPSLCSGQALCHLPFAVLSLCFRPLPARPPSALPITICRFIEIVGYLVLNYFVFTNIVGPSRNQFSRSLVFINIVGPSFISTPNLPPNAAIPESSSIKEQQSPLTIIFFNHLVAFRRISRLLSEAWRLNGFVSKNLTQDVY